MFVIFWCTTAKCKFFPHPIIGTQLLLFLLTSIVIDGAAYQPHRFGRPIKQDDRFFIVEQMLPALHREAVGKNLTFVSSDTDRPFSSYGDSIPVTYTNSPKGVSDWLAKNIPKEGVTIGFDVEVRIVLVESLRFLTLFE